MKRVFYLYDVPTGESRAGHALKACEQFVITMSGSFDVVVSVLCGSPECERKRRAMSIADCRIIALPKITDPRGNLTFIEGRRHIPFEIKRAHWIYDVPGGERRGGHACRQLHELLIALSGSFDVVVDDGEHRQTFPLNRSYLGLYVPNLTWRHIENFSTNAVCFVLASTFYAENDYIRDYEAFRRARGVSA